MLRQTCGIHETMAVVKSEGVVYLSDSGERAPMSVVWTTLPGISLFLPPIGHVGIADSKGITFDFSGPYQVRDSHIPTCRYHRNAYSSSQESGGHTNVEMRSRVLPVSTTGYCWIADGRSSKANLDP